MNFYEQEVLSSINDLVKSGKVLVYDDSSQSFQLLEQNYPLDSSRIDWRRVAGAVIEKIDGDNESEAFAHFFQSAVRNFELSGEVTYVGDSITNFSLVSDIDLMLTIIPIIISTIPQHHFFIGECGKWCVSFMSEGEAAFGFSSNAAFL